MQYHTNTHGPDEDGFGRALDKSIDEAENNGTNEVLLLTHTLHNLRGAISSILGEDFVKEFIKHRMGTSGQVVFYLETERIRSPFLGGIILAPFISHTLLAKALTDDRATDRHIRSMDSARTQ